MKKIKNGFTLIELLVVVLIIGILAAVALPQYRKAVVKSKIAKAVVELNALEKAEYEYYLANATYTGDKEALSVQADGACQAFSNSGGWGFCQKSIGSGVSLEWWWMAGNNIQHRCFAVPPTNKLANEICASYGTLYRAGSDRNEYLMKF